MKNDSNLFKMVSKWEPRGDQPHAIAALTEGFAQNQRRQTLLGVTGSGKTFTIACTIARLGLPTLVLAPNKTLAAQLYEELRGFFPENAVEYFVSYYDYYQPEAYVPTTDTYINKDATINDAIDRMRHSATRSLLEREDVVIVASVSCIYGIGSRESYKDMHVFVKKGDVLDRNVFLKKLTEIHYERNDIDFHRGTFRVRGDSVEVFPAHEDAHAVRLEWFGDDIESITLVDPFKGQKIQPLSKLTLYPASHYTVDATTRTKAWHSIREELHTQLGHLQQHHLLVEAQRLEQRTQFDLEMLEQTGYCNGIENYSRHLTGRSPGQPPPTLIDYFPKEFLLVVDESHQTIPQVKAMYKADRARKETLVNHGFRLPSALDNRPLKFEEFDALSDRIIYVSATPAEYELEQSRGVVVEQIIRPTGLLDPLISIHPAQHQVTHVLKEIKNTLEQGYRTLITTLTKRMAEDLTEYLQEQHIKVQYLHSDVDTLERIRILHDLRTGTYDVVVGINLLREGLDLPEVALVAVMDADKEGFLRSTRSLIQTIGRAARNSQGRVILYAHTLTESIQKAVEETERRRTVQQAYNQKHGIVPTSTKRDLQSTHTHTHASNEEDPSDDLKKDIAALKQEMYAAAECLEFEKAARIRDTLKKLEKEMARS
jgi:excinuclease ABC subunit B